MKKLTTFSGRGTQKNATTRPNCAETLQTASKLILFAAIFTFSAGFINTAVFAQEITYSEAFASLKTNRDRLLDSYALHTGRANRQQAWNEMTIVQKGVFLTITDMLGRRTFMNQNRNYTDTFLTPTQSDYDLGCVRKNARRNIDLEGAYISPYDIVPGGEQPLPDLSTPCELVDAGTCIERGHCAASLAPRTDHDMALNHVTTLYAVNGNDGGGCGGMNYHRLYFSADDELIYKLRNIDALGPVGWRRSEDLGGPHSPFTQSRETMHGQPRGQTQQWAWDYEAVYMTRPGVFGVYDPHLIEMDIDYNGIHDSNPECSYGGTYGRYKYQNTWYNQGLGGSAEYEYSPY